MCRRNFRVRVNLSEFYDDVRRSSWIYVDKDSISCIYHLQNHIIKVFDIKRSIHLMLESGEYLPPNEDSRILKEDETILVVPGTGLENNHSNPAKKISDLQVSKNCVVSQQKQCFSDPNVSLKAKQNESSEEEDEATTVMDTTSENSIFLSMINDSRMESASELGKSEVSLVEESPAPENSPLKNKRKRVRRKKSKIDKLPEKQPIANNSCEDDTEYKKPKIINSVTISNGKHIRFGDVEQLEFRGYDSSASNDSRKRDSKTGKNGLEDSYWDKPMTGSNLSNLLALRQSSTPITFGRKKTEKVVNQGNSEISEVKETLVEEKPILNKDIHAFTVDPKRHPPLMEGKVLDIIAFKMLKMASDYTPQISEYIIARLIQISADKSIYLFKIIDGQDEVQAPQGKFDLETDETEDTRADFISLNWSQLIEPRLIYRE